MFRSASSAATDTATLGINRPSGTAANDILIASIGVRPSTATIVPPSGWTLVRRIDNDGAGGSANSLAVFRKTAGGSEPASYAFDVTGAAYSVGGIQAFMNVDTANPIDVENGQITASAMTHATPSITTTVANAMLVTSHTFGTSTTWTPPAGMAEGFEAQFQPVAANQGQSIEGAYVLQAAAGASGAKTATATGSGGAVDPGTTHILALRPRGPELVIDLPAGTAANDVLIASIGVRPATAAITAPSGWTLVRRVDNNSTNPLSLAVFRKLAGSSEPAAYAFALSGAAQAVGGIQAFVNVDTANPIDVEAGQATPEALSHATPSVTTTVLNSLVVTSHTFATSSGWSPPTGMTEGFESQSEPQTSGAGMSIEGNYVLQGANAATGAKSAAAGVSADFGATHILALRPGAGTASLAIAKPAGTAANDVLIAAIGLRPGTATVGAPTGWTLVRRVDNSTDNSNSLVVLRKVAGSSEPTSYSFDLGGTGIIAAGGIQAFSGVDTATPIDAEAGQGTSGSLSHATPSITTTVANAMLVSAHTFASSSTWTPPAGMTEAFDTQYQPIHAGGGQATEGAYVLQANAGATGAKTATAAASSDFGATHLLALRPAPPAVAQLYFIHVDHLNTPRLVANSTGTTVWRWDQQEPFGVNIPDENPSGLGVFELPLRLPGQYFDKETNLFYNMARNYWPEGGRYLEADPLGLLAPTVRMLAISHLYAYVESNPLTLIDPTGEQAVDGFACRARCVIENIWDHYKCLEDSRNCANRCARKFAFDPDKKINCQKDCFGSEFDRCRKPYLDCIDMCDSLGVMCD